MYYVNLKDLEEECRHRETDAWYDVDENTVYVIVDVYQKRFDFYGTCGLLQHEITHAYQEYMKSQHGYKTVADDSYKRAITLCVSKDKDVSAAAMAVYFSRYGELSANANELYPWFVKTIRNNMDFNTYLYKNSLYYGVQQVRRLNDKINSDGNSVLSNASKQMGIPIRKLKNICFTFPKSAMAKICQVYTKAKEDIDRKLEETALDYRMSKMRRRLKFKLGFFDGSIEKEYGASD